MKKWKTLIIIVVITLFFAACQNEGKMSLPDEYIKEFFKGFIVDDSKPLSDLLTKEYTLRELKDFFGERPPHGRMGIGGNNDEKDLTISDVNRKYPIECLRKGKYSVYKVSEGGYFYVFWIKPINPSSPGEGFDQTVDEATVYFTAHMSSLRKAGDFASLKEGISTAADVANIDPTFELVFTMSSRTPSYSLLDDGTVMEICYYWEGNNLNSLSDLIVESKEIVSKNQCPSALAYILSSDLP